MSNDFNDMACNSNNEIEITGKVKFVIIYNDIKKIF